MTRNILRWSLAAIYILAGVAHIAFPHPFLLITPQWVPFPPTIVLLTGACEIMGGIGLFSTSWRKPAAIMLALYAACVFPANVRHAVEGLDIPMIPNNWWYHGPRLALQPLLVWAPLYSCSIVSWPFGAGLPSKND